MPKSRLCCVENGLKMVKNKRDLRSPRRNRSFTGSRPGSRVRSNCTVPGGNVRVVIRVRPPTDRESGDNSSTVIKVVDDHTIVFDPKEEEEPFFYHGVQQRNRDIMKRPRKNLQFTFDKVFSFESNNSRVFENSTKTLIDSLMNGYNCSVFVYGATGAGKTHTMLGRGEDPGITFLTMNELFRQKEELSQDRQFEIGMTYLEVYNETVQDLLNPGTALNLREDGKYGVVVAGIQVQRITKSEKLFELLEQGNRNRTQHPTDANSESSRSHAVFQVYLRMKIVQTNEVRVAKLSMIDLAGSERGAATGYNGARFTEGANINRSLLALGNCINSLADGQRHVPYRDSKLTRLLKDSLGGNCQTIMIANISPSSLSYEDTYNTLKYAMRATKIKSIMKKNVINSERNVNHYIKLVDELNQENENLKLQLALQQTRKCSCKETVTKEQPAEQLQNDVKDLLTVKRQLEERVHELEGNQQRENMGDNENKDDLNLQPELRVLYTEKKELELRILQLESALKLLIVRKKLKEDYDSRLSGICSDISDKEHGHRRLGNAVDRLERQIVTLQQDLAVLYDRKEKLEFKLKEFLDNTPHLQHVAEKENSDIVNIKANNKAEHLQKICDLQTGELRMRNQLIEQFSDVLKPCFMQLRGHGHATEALITKYHGLVRHLQGIRSVTWTDESSTSDSGVSCSTNSQAEDNKRKFNDDAEMDSTFVLSEAQSQVNTFMPKVETDASTKENTVDVNSLNQTRVLTPNKQRIVSAKHVMIKVFKSNQQPIKLRALSPHCQKENKGPLQTRQMFSTNYNRIHGQVQSKINKPYKSKITPGLQLPTSVRQKL